MIRTPLPNLPVDIVISLELQAGKSPQTTAGVVIPVSADTKIKVADLFFQSYKRRAEVETTVRIAFWTAIVVGAFTLPGPTGNNPAPSISIGVAAGFALAAFIMFALFMGGVLRANHGDLAPYRKIRNSLFNEVTGENKDDVIAEEKWYSSWSYPTQLIITLALLGLALVILKEHKVVSW